MGIRVKKLRYFRSYADTYYWQGVLYHTIGFVFTGRVGYQVKLNPADDVADAKFFLPKKIPWNKIAFKSVATALRDYLKISVY